MTSPNTEHGHDILSILLKQYEMCWTDKRTFESNIWQTPTISLAIVAVVLAGIISRPVTNDLLSITVTLVVLTFSFSVVLIGLIQLRKHRLFSIARTNDLSGIENYVRLNFGQLVYPVKFKTDEIANDRFYYPNVPRSWIDRRRAYEWLQGLVIAVVLGKHCDFSHYLFSIEIIVN